MIAPSLSENDDLAARLTRQRNGISPSTPEDDDEC